MSDFIQHIIIDNTLKRIGEAAFADYLCHAYCYDGYCTFERPRVGGQGPGMRNVQSFRFEAGDCLIIARRGDLVMNLKESEDMFGFSSLSHFSRYVQTNLGAKPSDFRE